MERIQSRYSEELREKAKALFEKRNGGEISDDDLEMYLDKLGQFILLFGDVMSKKFSKESNGGIKEETS